MRLIRGDGRDASDDDVTEALRSHYAAPTDVGYWALLERRIMARVLADSVASREWWSYFRGWTRIGIAAGVAAAVIAAAAAWRSEQRSERVAYEELLGASADSLILTEVLGSEPSPETRAATLRYLLSR
ncbi:MAG: hypothetical protein U0163_14825 [Gemmatimonadaceae bacterium]